MLNANMEENRSAALPTNEILRKEIEVLTGQRAALTKKSLRAAAWVQQLSKNYGLGIAGKLERVNFKLRFKQEQLAESKRQSPESARQKMERMIVENPSELEAHIRRAYQPLIAAEQIT